MKKGAGSKAGYRTVTDCARKESSLSKRYAQIEGGKSEMISLAAEQDAQETEMLIDSILSGAKMPDLQSFRLRISNS
ncbi:MAG: hypothetical protein P4N41_16765 [Negativicutes bacterium]|nr:hypothetical protein [Negativicutes bacterium]